MSFPISTWSDMMGTPIVWHAPSTGARSMFGTPSQAVAGSTFMARWKEINGSNRRLTGTDDYCSGVAWIASTSTGVCTRAGTFTLPDGTSPPIRSVEYVRDTDGSVHHTKVVFG